MKYTTGLFPLSFTQQKPSKETKQDSENQAHAEEHCDQLKNAFL